MKIVLGLRFLLAMFIAVLMPLELGHCAFMPQPMATVSVAADHHEDGDHDCCEESGASHRPASPSDDCCCCTIQVPVATAPDSVSASAPTSVPMPFVGAASVLAIANDPSVLARLEPNARTSSPPDPSSAPQSPRSPPFSA